jgi:hypothetical protein
MRGVCLVSTPAKKGDLFGPHCTPSLFRVYLQENATSKPVKCDIKCRCIEAWPIDCMFLTLVIRKRSEMKSINMQPSEMVKQTFVRGTLINLRNLRLRSVPSRSLVRDVATENYCYFVFSFSPVELLSTARHHEKHRM